MTDFHAESIAQFHLDLIDASEAVIDNWQKGDLAAAVRKLNAALANLKPARRKRSSIESPPHPIAILEAIYKWWTETPGFQNGEDDMPAEIFDAMRDAIAKREGRQ